MLTFNLFIEFHGSFWSVWWPRQQTGLTCPGSAGAKLLSILTLRGDCAAKIILRVWFLSLQRPLFTILLFSFNHRIKTQFLANILPWSAEMLLKSRRAGEFAICIAIANKFSGPRLSYTWREIFMYFSINGTQGGWWCGTMQLSRVILSSKSP